MRPCPRRHPRRPSPSFDESVAQSIEVIPVVIGLRFRQASPARVLRVFRGEIREGMTDRYLSAARAGAIRDAESGEGPHGYFLGLVDDHRFVSVSVWPSWDEIQQVTGGTAQHPVATRHGELLRRARPSTSRSSSPTGSAAAADRSEQRSSTRAA